MLAFRFFFSHSSLMKKKFINHILKRRSRTLDVVISSLFLFVVVSLSASMVSADRIKENFVKFGKALEQSNMPPLEYADFADSSKGESLEGRSQPS